MSSIRLLEVRFPSTSDELNELVISRMDVGGSAENTDGDNAYRVL